MEKENPRQPGESFILCFGSPDLTPTIKPDLIEKGYSLEGFSGLVGGSYGYRGIRRLTDKELTDLAEPNHLRIVEVVQRGDTRTLGRDVCSSQPFIFWSSEGLERAEMYVTTAQQRRSG